MHMLNGWELDMLFTGPTQWKNGSALGYLRWDTELMRSRDRNGICNGKLHRIFSKDTYSRNWWSTSFWVSQTWAGLQHRMHTDMISSKNFSALPNWCAEKARIMLDVLTGNYDLRVHGNTPPAIDMQKLFFAYTMDSISKISLTAMRAQCVMSKTSSPNPLTKRTATWCSTYSKMSW